MRQVVLDTETTGLLPAQGHRIIEIGCVELINRRITGSEFHRFLNPDRDIDEGAGRVHGISREDLESAPRFSEIVDEFLGFVRDAELVIHNAEFDVGFVDHELGLMQHPQPQLTKHASVLDTLALARRMHPGQRNSLDALCKRYDVDATRRHVHGALIDAELLARVYLAMTGGQTALLLDDGDAANPAVAGDFAAQAQASRERASHLELVVVTADRAEMAAHEAMLEELRKDGACIWDRL